MARVLGCCIFTVRVGAVRGRDSCRSLLLLILFVVAVVLVSAATGGIVKVAGTSSTASISNHSRIRITMIALAFVETWAVSDRLLVHPLLVPIDRTICIATINRAGMLLVRDLILMVCKMVGAGWISSELASPVQVSRLLRLRLLKLLLLHVLVFLLSVVEVAKGWSGQIGRAHV